MDGDTRETFVRCVEELELYRTNAIGGSITMTQQELDDLIHPMRDALGSEPDDDPRCTNCGCYRSEHGMEPCDGFTTKPGGFVVYTGDDLEQMTYEEKAEAFGWSDHDDDMDRE